MSIIDPSGLESAQRYKVKYKKVLCCFCGGDGLKHDKLIHEKVEDDCCPNCQGGGYVEEMK